MQMQMQMRMKVEKGKNSDRTRTRTHTNQSKFFLLPFSVCLSDWPNSNKDGFATQSHLKDAHAATNWPQAIQWTERYSYL